MATLWDTEAGLVAMAEEFRLLGQSYVALRMLIGLYQRPMSDRELRNLCTSGGNFNKWTAWLENRGLIHPIVMASKTQAEPGRIGRIVKRKFWFLVDQQIGLAIHETLEFVWRQLNAKTTELRGVIDSLDRFQGVTWKASHARVKWSRIMKELDRG